MMVETFQYSTKGLRHLKHFLKGQESWFIYDGAGRLLAALSTLRGLFLRSGVAFFIHWMPA